MAGLGGPGIRGAYVANRVSQAAINAGFYSAVIDAFLRLRALRPTSTMQADPYELTRFAEAQEGVYETALAELRQGRKRSHWMWFVFPQFLGLGSSAMSQRYAIRSVDEARGYLRDPVLGPRLRECCEALLEVQGRSAREILGTPDDLKLRSCATLFDHVAAPGSVFAQVLDRFFEGQRDASTLRLIDVSERR